MASNELTNQLMAAASGERTLEAASKHERRCSSHYACASSLQSPTTNEETIREVPWSQCEKYYIKLLTANVEGRGELNSPVSIRPFLDEMDKTVRPRGLSPRYSTTRRHRYRRHSELCFAAGLLNSSLERSDECPRRRNVKRKAD
jgi:hypothetical protein